MPQDLNYLSDIVQAARLIQEFVVGLDKEQFENDIKSQDAVIRRLEIIGEATQQLSGHFKADHLERHGWNA